VIGSQLRQSGRQKIRMVFAEATSESLGVLRTMAHPPHWNFPQ
jgi:hypothetical protein